MVQIHLYNIISEVAIYKSNNNKYSICVRFKSNHPTGYTVAMIEHNEGSDPDEISCYITTYIHDNNISGWEFVKFINDDIINNIFKSMENTFYDDDASVRFGSYWFPISLDNKLTVDDFDNMIFRSFSITF